MAITKKKPARKKALATNATPKKAVKAAVAKVMSLNDLADLLGVKLTKRLDTPAVRRLRKALPGYVNMLNDVATMLERDSVLLNLRDVRPDELLDLQARHEHLSAREDLVEVVHRSIYEQRLQVDDEAMGKLFKIARRIESMAEDDPGVRLRWKSVLDFLAKFRRGGSAAPPVRGGGSQGG